jgi:Rod binding domain-containing protein
MLAPMFENLDTDGLGGGGAGERMFRPMLVEQYAKAIAQAGGIGLADSVIAEMLRMQGMQMQPVAGEADGADR